MLPTLGSKEAIFHLAQVLGGGQVAIPAPAYPVYERGALFAGKRVLELPLTRGGRLPARPRGGRRPQTWRDVAVLWLNYPNNPTAATAPRALYERAAELAREHDFVVASDEAYSEIYFGDEPPLSMLELADLSGVLVFNTLSKRSSMPGYRSGFMAGDPALIALLKRYRPNVGTAPQEFIQRAAVAAWSDEEHVEQVRASYRAKRDVLLRRARGARAAQRGRRCDLLPLARRRARRRRAGRAADRPTGSCSRRARSSAPPAPATCGSRSCRRWPSASAPPSASTSCCSYSFACSAAFRPAQRPLRGRASIAPVCELRRNSSPSAPLSSAALTTSPSGSATREPPVT